MKNRTAFITGMVTQHLVLTAIGQTIKRLAQAQRQQQNHQAILDFLAAANGQGFDEPADGEAGAPYSDVEQAFQGWDPNGAH